MRRVLVVESLTLDGVMQAPGAPDEDRRGGFEHGGWAQPYMDEVMGSEMAKGMGRPNCYSDDGPTTSSTRSGRLHPSRIPSPRC